MFKLLLKDAPLLKDYKDKFIGAMIVKFDNFKNDKNFLEKTGKNIQLN